MKYKVGQVVVIDREREYYCRSSSSFCMEKNLSSYLAIIYRILSDYYVCSIKSYRGYKAYGWQNEMIVPEEAIIGELANGCDIIALSKEDNKGNINPVYSGLYKPPYLDLINFKIDLEKFCNDNIYDFRFVVDLPTGVYKLPLTQEVDTVKLDNKLLKKIYNSLGA